jgi:hypothetical protein
MTNMAISSLPNELEKKQTMQVTLANLLFQLLFSITQHTWDNTYCKLIRCRSRVSPDDVACWLFLHKQA